MISADGEPHVELTSFVGRTTEIAEGRRLLGTARLLTLVGPGGVGKTRLARRLADQTARAFPDGTFVIALSPLLDPAEVAAAFASALGLEDLTRTPEAALAAFASRRRVLLVVDDCEHLTNACARLVADLLRQAPELRVLATSRQPLGVAGEQLLTIAPLSLPAPGAASREDLVASEAVTLFVERARLVDPGFTVDEGNAALVGRLCTMLDGMPLAIELAAARLRLLSVRRLLERINDRFSILAIGSSASVSRHQTLRASMDWSYELCSAEEQAVWARMSLFEGGADLEAVEAVLAGDQGSAFEAVAGLVDKSVVVAEEVDGWVRYSMLETVRAYGRDRLAERGELEVQQTRHRDYYVALAQRVCRRWFGPGQRDLLARTSADLGNLRAALNASFATPGGREQALDLTTSMWWFWSSVGAMEDGMRWQDRALSPPLPATPRSLHALSMAAFVAAMRNDRDQVARYVEQARALSLPEWTAAEAPDSVRSDLRRLQTLATVETGDLEAAIVENARALRDEAQVERLGPETTVEVLMTLSVSLAWAGRPAEALAHIESAARLCRFHGDEWYLSYLLCLQGARLLELGRFAEALDSERECLRLARDLNTFSVVNAVEFVSDIYPTLGLTTDAAVLYGALSGIWPTIGGSLAESEASRHASGQLRTEQMLGEERFAEAFARGREMTLDDVVTFVLGVAAAPDASAAQTTPTSSIREAGVALSRREREVARLIAQGLSNKEIAQKLVISTRTAEGHVTRLLHKLGFASRAMVATWYTERNQITG